MYRLCSVRADLLLGVEADNLASKQNERTKEGRKE